MGKTSAAAAAAAALPDDAIEEILIRVDDIATLFRCTATCKPWRTLVARPSFLRRHWPEDSAELCSLFGFFAPQEEEHGGEQMFVPAPRSPLGRCSLASFFPDAAGLLEHAEPATSRRGLLLVLLPHRDPDGGIRLAVCNPLAGTCDVLPQLNLSDVFFDKYGCAILTGADLSSKAGRQLDPLPGYSTFFKVLICVNDDVWGDDSERISCGYALHTFSSNEPSWTEPRECFDQLHVYDLEMVGGAVVCQGTAHWLLKSKSDYYALQVSADTAGHVVSFTKLWLDNSHNAWFHVGSHGSLSLLVVAPSCLDNKIEVWTRRPDDGDSATEWLHTGMIELQNPKQKQQALTSLFRKMKLQKRKQKRKVGTLTGTMLFSNSGMLFVADLTTGAVEDVTAQFSGLEGRTAVPFKANWTDFFSSRLGSGRN